jgi:hypothetical protein
MKTLPVHWAPFHRFHQSGKEYLLNVCIIIVLKGKFIKSKTFSALALKRDAHDRGLRRKELKIFIMLIKPE